LLLPGADGTPILSAFVSEDEEVGHYFGPHIFAGTPFENAPVIVGKNRSRRHCFGGVDAVRILFSLNYERRI